MDINTCKRCGMAWETDKKKNQTCPSCRVRKQTVIGECVPWQGAYDRDQITPILDGLPVYPGTRTCGHSDCVNINHIRREN